MTDYSDLTDNVRNYTETSTNILSDTIIQPFIESVEDKIRRTVDLNYYRKYDTATLTVNNPYLPLPSDWEATRYVQLIDGCLLYTSPSPRDRQKSRMPSSA